MPACCEIILINCDAEINLDILNGSIYMVNDLHLVGQFLKMHGMYLQQNTSQLKGICHCFTCLGCVTGFEGPGRIRKVRCAATKAGLAADNIRFCKFHPPISDHLSPLEKLCKAEYLFHYIDTNMHCMGILGLSILAT